MVRTIVCDLDGSLMNPSSGIYVNEAVKEELIEVAKRLRNKNNCDLVVANDLSNIRNGEHIGYIIDKTNEIEEAHGKDDIAKKLVRKMFNDGKK